MQAVVSSITKLTKLLRNLTIAYDGIKYKHQRYWR